MQYPIGKLPLGQLHGKLLKRATVRGVTLAETTYSPNLQVIEELNHN